jgi:hypothetical protein
MLPSLIALSACAVTLSLQSVERDTDVEGDSAHETAAARRVVLRTT